MDGDSVKIYECTASGTGSVSVHWSPANVIPDCVPEPVSPEDDSNYDVQATIHYRSGGFAPASCIAAYQSYVASFFRQLNELLSKRCEAATGTKIDVHFANSSVAMKADTNELSITYVLRIDTSARQRSFYEHCGMTLGIAFDLSVPSSSHIIESLLNIDTQQVSSCPSLNVSGNWKVGLGILNLITFFRIYD